MRYMFEAVSYLLMCLCFRLVCGLRSVFFAASEERFVLISGRGPQTKPGHACCYSPPSPRCLSKSLSVGEFPCSLSENCFSAPGHVTASGWNVIEKQKMSPAALEMVDNRNRNQNTQCCLFHKAAALLSLPALLSGSAKCIK